MEKKKNLNSTPRLIVMLFLISALTALALGIVNHMTEGPIAQHTLDTTNAALAEVMPGGDYTFNQLDKTVSNTEVTAIYTAEDASGVQGYVVESVVFGSQGNIDMVVGVDLNQTVTGLAIISNPETAGLGSKASDADWRAQFAGKSGTLAVDKDGGDIVSLTGATISSRAVVKGVNNALETVAELG